MKNQKEVTVGQDMFVAFAYKLTDDKSGELLFETPKDAPDTIVYGVTPGVTPGLLMALKDLKAGDKFGVTLPPEAACHVHFLKRCCGSEKTARLLFVRRRLHK